MAHIQKLPNGKFRVSMCVDRKRASRVIRAKSMKDAERQAVLMEERLRETGSLDGKTPKELRTMTFNDLWDAYIKWQTEERNKKIRPKTHQKYKDIMEYQLEPFFKGMRVVHITEDDINKFLNWLRNPESRFNKTKKKAYKDGTIKDAFVLLNHMLNYAVIKKKVISENPCDGVDRPTIEDRGEMVYYDNVQLETLLDVMDKETELKIQEIEAKRATGRYKDFTLQKEKIQALYKQASVYICVYTACRRGEALGLHRDDIDFENMTIHFCHEVLYTKVDGIFMTPYLKGAKENTVGLHSDLAGILKNLINELDILFEVSNGVIPYTDRLFMGLNTTKHHVPGGLPFPDRYSEWFLEMLEHNNLPRITMHKLRHSSISYMLYRGVPKSVVAKIAGQATEEQINKTYGHDYDSVKFGAAQVFDNIRSKGDRVNEQGREAESSSCGTWQEGSSQGD